MTQLLLSLRVAGSLPRRGALVGPRSLENLPSLVSASFSIRCDTWTFAPMSANIELGSF
jgi:hypothetical protein